MRILSIPALQTLSFWKISEIASSSPTRPHLPNFLARSRPSLGITRTHSGSLISDLSKQPTPAPSSPGAENPPAVFGADEDPFVDTGLGICDDTDFALNSLITPTATPTRPATKEAQLETDLARYKCLAEKLRNKAEDQERIAQSRVCDTFFASH